MNDLKSHKWITSGRGKALNVHKVQAVFGPVAKNPVNLISIFGRARQGKSFLMNCLAGEREIFKISNEKDSCTQGIDISNKWLNLSEFSRIDGAKQVSGKAEGIKVGFVDAEGQGDKDVAYDANLICPILLTSKCVIFNWKGDLQKDHILSTLGIMAKAAQNVTTEASLSSASSGKPKFGHLHIIFRDWQAVKTDEAAVFNTLLGIEGTTEASTRDIIRADLLSSFESIRVWLFEAPSEYTKDLRQKLTFEKTSLTFRAHLRELREALAEQLREPTRIAGNALTGRAYAPLTEQIAEALNSGTPVLPSSAYLGMLRQEALHLVRQYEGDVRAQMQQLLESIDNPFSSSSPSKAGSATDLYVTRTEAEHRFALVVSSIGIAFQTRLHDMVGNVAPAPGSMAATIVEEFNEQTAEIDAAVKGQFLAHYSQQFTAWLLKARRNAEHMLEHELAVLDKKLPLSDDPASSLGLQSQLGQVLRCAMRLVGGTQHFGADCAEAADAEQLLQRHFDHLSSAVKTRNTALLRAQKEEAERYLRAAMASMERALEESVEDLTANSTSGYLMKALEDTLNQQYHVLKERLKGNLKDSAEREQVLAQFDWDCGALRNRMVEKYNLAKEQALSKAVMQGTAAMDATLASIDVQELWQDVPLEGCEEKLDTCLQQIASDVEASLVETYASGWLLRNSANPADPVHREQQAKEKRFLAELHSAVHGPVLQNFRAVWVEELLSMMQNQQEAARQAQDDVDMDYEEEEEKSEVEGSEEQEEEEEVQSAVREVSLNAPRAKKSSGSTAADQRQRAAEWAAKALGVKLGAKAPARARGKKAPVPAPKVKSVEQQRADALAYAKKAFGAHIGDSSPPPLPSPPAAKPASSAVRGASRALFTDNDPEPTTSSSRRASSAATVKAEPVRARSKRGSQESPDEGDLPDAAPAGRKQASTLPSPPAAANRRASAPPAPAAVEKVDPVKAARQEAQRLAQERAAAAASAAANRIAAKGKGKK